MKKQPVQLKPGRGVRPHPLWMRLLTVFCMALLGVASTVQVCHTHNDPSEPTLQSFSHPAAHPSLPASPDSDSSSNSAVRCPLCVAMHSALPVTHTLIQVATLHIQPRPEITASVPRLFLWRSQMASRPPPAAAHFA